MLLLDARATAAIPAANNEAADEPLLEDDGNGCALVALEAEVGRPLPMELKLSTLTTGSGRASRLSIRCRDAGRFGCCSSSLSCITALSNSAATAAEGVAPSVADRDLAIIIWWCWSQSVDTSWASSSPSATQPALRLVPRPASRRERRLLEPAAEGKGAATAGAAEDNDDTGRPLCDAYSGDESGAEALPNDARCRLPNACATPVSTVYNGDASGCELAADDEEDDVADAGDGSGAGGASDVGTCAPAADDAAISSNTAGSGCAAARLRRVSLFPCGLIEEEDAAAAAGAISGGDDRGWPLTPPAAAGGKVMEACGGSSDSRTGLAVTRGVPMPKSARDDGAEAAETAACGAAASTAAVTGTTAVESAGETCSARGMEEEAERGRVSKPGPFLCGSG